VVCSHFSDGGAGAEDLARRVINLAERDDSQFKLLYEDDLSLWDKVKTIATRLYDADDIVADKKIRQRLEGYEKAGFGHLPVCIAKTQYSFSTDPSLRGAPSHHTVPIREVRLAAGAEFVVVICGEVMTMPGLPRRPAAASMGVDEQGQVCGLF